MYRVAEDGRALLEAAHQVHAERHGAQTFLPGTCLSFLEAAKRTGIRSDRQRSGFVLHGRLHVAVDAERMPSVMLRLACPKVSWTILGLTFFLASSVAHVCLRSWKRISGRPARLRRGLKWRFTTFWVSSGVPLPVADTSPESL
jgi:hypothetical protein